MLKVLLLYMLLNWYVVMFWIELLYVLCVVIFIVVRCCIRFGVFLMCIK